jgi:hypothetical protein
MAAGAVCWFFSNAWFPTVKQAIRQLPDTGGIANATLVSPHASTEPLARSRFIAFVVDTEGKAGADVASDVLVTFRRHDVRVCSLLGCADQPYEKKWEIAFSRLELEAAWGAWRPTLLAVTGLGTVASLFLSWIGLATLAFPAVRIYAFFKDRRLTLSGSWKLSAASLLPGALLASALIVLYGLGVIDLVRFLIGWCLHFFVSLIYLLVAPLRLPRVAEMIPAARNPFAAPSPDAVSESAEETKT